MTSYGGISSIATTNLISIIYIFLISSKLAGVTLAVKLALLFVKPIQCKTCFAYPLESCTVPPNSLRADLLCFNNIPRVTPITMFDPTGVPLDLIAVM